MTRPLKEVDLRKEALRRYEELLKQRNKIEGELKGLELYLKSVGEIPARRRGRSKKVEQPTAEAPRKATTRAKPKPAVGKTRTARPKGKVSATDSILSAIAKADRGISVNEIMQKTGFKRLTVFGVLIRMKKQGKVKAVKRGVYVKRDSAAQKGAKRHVETKKPQAVLASSAAPKKAPKSRAKAPAKKTGRARAKGKGPENISAPVSTQA